MPVIVGVADVDRNALYFFLDSYGSSSVNVAPFATIAGGNAACTGSKTPTSCCISLLNGTCPDDTGLGGPVSLTTDSAGNIYVANGHGGLGNYGSVTIYPPLGSNTGLLNESPIATIAGQFNISCTGAGEPYACCTSAGNGGCNDNTGLAFPTGIALDSSENIFVTNKKGGSCLDGGVGCFQGGSPTGFGSVTGYQPLGGTAGLLSAAPFTTISGQFNDLCETAGIPYTCCTDFHTGTCVDNALLSGPQGLFVDPAHNDIYVTNAGDSSASITKYSGGSSGNVAPALVITGADTGLNDPFGIALEQFFPFELIVANNNSSALTTYSLSGGGGDLAPLASITSGIGEPAGIDEVQIDGQLFTFVANSIDASITVYNSDGALISTLSGSNTGLNQPRGVVVIPSP